MVDVNIPSGKTDRTSNQMVRNSMKKKILLIDDDQIFHYLHSKVIALAGIEADIITAGHGLEALEIITKMIERDEELPTEIFIDLNMPNMNGFEFIRAINDFDFPVKDRMKMVVVTSSVNAADREIADQLGIKYYLTKPLVVRDMVEILSVDANRAD
jgi:CheY-like chemotaxis protein